MKSAPFEQQQPLVVLAAFRPIGGQMVDRRPSWPGELENKCNRWCRSLHRLYHGRLTRIPMRVPLNVVRRWRYRHKAARAHTVIISSPTDPVAKGNYGFRLSGSKPGSCSARKLLVAFCGGGDEQAAAAAEVLANVWRRRGSLFAVRAPPLPFVTRNCPTRPSACAQATTSHTREKVY